MSIYHYLGYAAALGLLFTVLRRVPMRALVPELIVLLVFGVAIAWCYRMIRFRDLGEVVTEYRALTAMLDALDRPTYRQLVERAMRNMVSARDRAEMIRDLLRGESVDELRQRLVRLESDHATTTDGEQRASIARTIAETRETIANLQRLQDFLLRYQRGKEHLASHFRKMRIRLQASALDPDQAVTVQGADELDAIIHDLSTLDAVYDSVDASSHLSANARAQESSVEAPTEPSTPPPVVADAAEPPSPAAPPRQEPPTAH